MLKHNQELKSYSETFKFKVLTEIENGRYTKNEAARFYGISTGSIYQWMKKYDKLALLNKRVRIETMEEIDRLKAQRLQRVY